MKKGVIALFHQKWVRALILAQLQLILAEMTTDYLLFIHGVNVRETGYSQTLFNLIKEKSPSSLPLKRIELFWGKVVETELNKLRGSLEQSQVWPRFWFKHFRSKEIFNFAGDAALYISRHLGSLAVRELEQQASNNLLHDLEG